MRNKTLFYGQIKRSIPIFICLCVAASFECRTTDVSASHRSGLRSLVIYGTLWTFAATFGSYWYGKSRTECRVPSTIGSYFLQVAVCQLLVGTVRERVRLRQHGPIAFNDRGGVLGSAEVRLEVGSLLGGPAHLRLVEFHGIPA